MNTRRFRFYMRGVTLVELIVSIVIIGASLAGILMVILRNTGASADPMIWHQSVAIAEGPRERAFRDAEHLGLEEVARHGRAIEDDESARGAR